MKTTKPEVIEVPELSDPDETFFHGRHMAGVHGKTIHIMRRYPNRTIPIMEFERGGKYNEILAPRLRASIMDQMVHRIESLPTTKQTAKKISQYAGVELVLSEK